MRNKYIKHEIRTYQTNSKILELCSVPTSSTFYLFFLIQEVLDVIPIFTSQAYFNIIILNTM